MYNHFFLLFKAVKFRFAFGKILYAFILYISLRQIIVLAFLSKLPLGTVHFIEEKKNGCIQRQRKRIKTRPDGTVSHIPPSQAL